MSGLGGLDWADIAAQLDTRGWALTGPVLPAPTCAALAADYDRAELYRNRVVMARHGFGRGEYQYFAYPLPPLVSALRTDLYAGLAPIANRWMTALGDDRRFPQTLSEMTGRCHAAGQTQPTPLLLRYGRGDDNCLHQDLYGEEVFPLQAAFLLNEILRRDRLDTEREVSPLKAAADAVVVQTDGLSVKEALERVLGAISQRS